MPQNNQILIKTSIQTTKRIDAKVGTNKPINASIGKSVSGATSYPPLTDKPQINDVILLGNKSFEDLGISDMSNLEIKEMFDRIFKNEGGN